MKTLLTTTALMAGLTASGAQAAVIYASDSFEGESAGTFSTSPNTTSYVNTGDNAGNAVIFDNISSTGINTADPAGKHLGIAGNLNKHVTQTTAMTLDSDNISSLEISLKVYFNNNDSLNVGRLIYSGLGDFTDSTVIQAFDADPTADPDNYVYSQQQWFDALVTINAADVGGFTDTAKLRWSQTNGGRFNGYFVIDDVVITGITPNAIPEPTSFVVGGLGLVGLCVRRRRRAN